MIKRTFMAGAVSLMALGLAVSLSGPVRAISVINGNFQQGVTYHFEYELTDLTGMRLPRDGGIDLRFYNNNIITGNYDPNDYLSFIPVSGGRDGNQFWLDIGSSTMHLLHISGTIQTNGNLVGYAYRGASTHEFEFKATLVGTKS